MLVRVHKMKMIDEHIFLFTISCVPKAEAQLSSVCPTSSMKFTSKAATESRKVKEDRK